MDIERLDFVDIGSVLECHDVHIAALRADDPGGPAAAAQVFGYWLEYGWTGDPGEVWLARDGGALSGWYRLELPDLDHRDLARLTLVVTPDRRRRGIGRELLRHAVVRAAAAGGRATLSGAALAGTGPAGSAGAAFARASGAIPGITDVRRVPAVRDLSPGRLSELRAEAERAAAGYSLVTWTGLIPPELLDPVARMEQVMADSVSDQRDTWDAARVDKRSNRMVRTTDLRRYWTGARHDTTGELVAITRLEVDPADPAWGHQGLTAVTVPHRGHRLGLLVKAALMQWFMTAEPLVERVHTTNSDDNVHMIAINDALGYRILGPATTWWRMVLGR